MRKKRNIPENVTNAYFTYIFKKDFIFYLQIDVIQSLSFSLNDKYGYRNAFELNY